MPNSILLQHIIRAEDVVVHKHRAPVNAEESRPASAGL
jgi:hypothetical protein